MKSIKVKNCGSCILLHTDENWDSSCKLDRKIQMPHGDDEPFNVDEGVHVNCPLRKEDLQIGLKLC